MFAECTRERDSFKVRMTQLEEQMRQLEEEYARREKTRGDKVLDARKRVYRTASMPAEGAGNRSRENRRTPTAKTRKTGRCAGNRNMFVGTAQAVAKGSESHHAHYPRTYVFATSRESPTTPGAGSATTDASSRAAANVGPAAAEATADTADARADDHNATADDASHRTDTVTNSSADDGTTTGRAGAAPAAPTWNMERTNPPPPNAPARLQPSL